MTDEERASIVELGLESFGECVRQMITYIDKTNELIICAVDKDPMFLLLFRSELHELVKESNRISQFMEIAKPHIERMRGIE